MEENLTVAAVARQIGVAPATLRTWDRRYGLGPSSHESGSHRRYCPADLVRLVLMRRLITAGVAPCDAAAKAKSAKAPAKFIAAIPSYEVKEELVEAIYRAAVAFDKPFITKAIAKEIEKNGVSAAWQQVIVPSLVMVGQAWEETGKGIATEHLFTEILIGLFRDFSPEIKKPVNSRPVLLAAVGEELHSLAIHALEAALAERNIACHFLGARTPLEALSGMVSKCAPPAIFLWAQLSENADPSFFRDLPSQRPAPRILLGGPGWDASECDGAVLVTDLAHACEEISRAVGV